MEEEKFAQRQAFLTGEGDCYFYRNTDTYWAPTIYNDCLSMFGIKPERLLEIGCGTTRNLRKLHQDLGESTELYGIDPSAAAIQYGMEQCPSLRLGVGTADVLAFEDNFFDVVIFGGCLYLCDRSVLFSIAAEADRVLRSGGYMIISDFLPPFPYRNVYAPKPGLFAYKMDYSRMFLWNPEYTLIGRMPSVEQNAPTASADERWAISILSKREFAENCPTSPFIRHDEESC